MITVMQVSTILFQSKIRFRNISLQVRSFKVGCDQFSKLESLFGYLNWIYWRYSNDLYIASFKTESFYNLVTEAHNPTFWTTAQMGLNHGTCTNNKNECRTVTINSEVCFSRDDATPQTPHANIQDDYTVAFNYLNDKKGFLKTSIDVASVSSNGDTLEITDSKGIEGVDDVWFRFSFSDTGASGAVDICGSVTTVWDEVNRKGKVILSHYLFCGQIFSVACRSNFSVGIFTILIFVIVYHIL